MTTSKRSDRFCVPLLGTVPGPASPALQRMAAATDFPPTCSPSDPNGHHDHHDPRWEERWRPVDPDADLAELEARLLEHRLGEAMADGERWEAFHHAQQHGHATFLPTPTEIAAGCLAAQGNWSEPERQLRAAKVVHSFEVPVQTVDVSPNPTERRRSRFVGRMGSGKPSRPLPRIASPPPWPVRPAEAAAGGDRRERRRAKRFEMLRAMFREGDTVCELCQRPLTLNDPADSHGQRGSDPTLYKTGRDSSGANTYGIACLACATTRSRTSRRDRKDARLWLEQQRSAEPSGV